MRWVGDGDQPVALGSDRAAADPLHQPPSDQRLHVGRERRPGESEAQDETRSGIGAPHPERLAQRVGACRADDRTNGKQRKRPGIEVDSAEIGQHRRHDGRHDELVDGEQDHPESQHERVDPGAAGKNVRPAPGLLRSRCLRVRHGEVGCADAPPRSIPSHSIAFIIPNAASNLLIAADRELGYCGDSSGREASSRIAGYTRTGAKGGQAMKMLRLAVVAATMAVAASCTAETRRRYSPRPR